jgi:hypothetical protein
VALIKCQTLNLRFSTNAVPKVCVIVSGLGSLEDAGGVGLEIDKGLSSSSESNLPTFTVGPDSSAESQTITERRLPP